MVSKNISSLPGVDLENSENADEQFVKPSLSGTKKVSNGPILSSSALLFAAGAYLGFGDKIANADAYRTIVAGICALGATSSLAYYFSTRREKASEHGASEQALNVSSNQQVSVEKDKKYSNARPFTDDLTGLGNHLRIEEKFKTVSEKVGDKKFTIGVVNLDGMRPINDLFGTAGGDHLLKQCATRMRAAVEENGFIFRQKGDQFAFILPDVEEESEVLRIGKLIQDVLTAPFDIDGSAVRVSGSFGFAIYPEGGDNYVDILENVETALYHSKRKGRGRVSVYNADIEATVLENAAIEQALRRAISENGIVPHYQPIISLQDGTLLGFESLARWIDPALGFVSPAKFIPLAEERGIIAQLTEVLLLQAAKTAADWPEDLFLSFNLSSAQLVDPTTAQSILNTIKRGGLPADRLEIEVTETAMMSDPEIAAQIIEELHVAGVRISMDDFGTGQSSLGRLRELKLDKVKIDRAFIMAIGEDKPAEHIVKAILEMCVGLDLTVVAEGIEEIEQAEALKKFGCHAAQGYLFGKPQDANKTMGYIREFRKTAKSDREAKVA